MFHCYKRHLATEDDTRMKMTLIALKHVGKLKIVVSHLKSRLILKIVIFFKTQTGYKRMSDNSENLSCVKKKRETFVIKQKKTPLINCNPQQVSKSNVTTGDRCTKKDKALSMRYV